MKGPKAFRVGRVRAALRGKSWYLTYHEHGRRHRPRIGPDRELARQTAAQINAQLEVGAPAALSFDPIPISELRCRWLEHHEQVRRSSVSTIRRYRAATEHLIRFVAAKTVPSSTGQFRANHAEEFVRYLRTLQISSNGHENTTKRSLLDKGLRYILETCRAMFRFAIRRRHLPPYTENPFCELEIDRMPIDFARPIVVFSTEMERQFLTACDDWQFPVFLTLALTGMRPGELTRLLLPDDLDLQAAVLRIQNKPRLGWQVKTREEREIPLVDCLVDVLRIVLGDRTSGPVFLRRRFLTGEAPPLSTLGTAALERELAERVAERQMNLQRALTRQEWTQSANSIWSDSGALKTDRLRTEFVRVTKRIGHPHQTAPKVLRHSFATCLQDANVDPLVRNELMGHTAERSERGNGLGMTANYTHTRPETRRRQLEAALRDRPAIELANTWRRQAAHG